MRPLKRLRSRIGRSVLIYKLRRLLLRPSLRLAARLAILPAAMAVALAVLAVQGHLAKMVESARMATNWLRMQEDMAIVGLHIESNLPELAPTVAEAVGLHFPISPLDVDPVAIRQRIETLPAVTAARLHVRRDAVLQIDVDARPPALLWRNAEGLFLIDAGGRRIGRAGHRSDRPELRLIAGDGADAATAEALLILGAIEPLAAHVRGLVRIGRRRWTIVLDGGRRILLPSANAVAAARRASDMCVSESLLARSIKVLDMRNPDRPTIRMQSAALARLGLPAGDDR